MWRSVLLAEETSAQRKPLTCCKSLTSFITSSAPRSSEVWTHNFRYKKNYWLYRLHCVTSKTTFAMSNPWLDAVNSSNTILLFLNYVFVQHILTVAKSHILSVLSSEALTSILLSLDQATSDIPCKILIHDYFVKTANLCKNNSPGYLRW